MKTIVTMTNGKRVERRADYRKVQQEISINRVVWRAYCHQNSLAVWEVPADIVKRITIIP